MEQSKLQEEINKISEKIIQSKTVDENATNVKTVFFFSKLDTF